MIKQINLNVLVRGVTKCKDGRYFVFCTSANAAFTFFTEDEAKEGDKISKNGGTFEYDAQYKNWVCILD